MRCTHAGSVDQEHRRKPWKKEYMAVDGRESQKPRDWIQLPEISEKNFELQNGKVWPLDRKMEKNMLTCLENGVPCFGSGGGIWGVTTHGPM